MQRNCSGINFILFNLIKVTCTRIITRGRPIDSLSRIFEIFVVWRRRRRETSRTPLVRVLVLSFRSDRLYNIIVALKSNYTIPIG